MGWQDKLRNAYSSEEDWAAYALTYGLHERLGYASPEDAWEANPTVQGSVNPSDYRRVGK
jgi:hypothetical protein